MYNTAIGSLAMIPSNIHLSAYAHCSRSRTHTHECIDGGVARYFLLHKNTGWVENVEANGKPVIFCLYSPHSQIAYSYLYIVSLFIVSSCACAYACGYNTLHTCVCIQRHRPKQTIIIRLTSSSSSTNSVLAKHSTRKEFCSPLFVRRLDRWTNVIVVYVLTVIVQLRSTREICSKQHGTLCAFWRVVVVVHRRRILFRFFFSLLIGWRVCISEA